MTMAMTDDAGDADGGGAEAFAQALRIVEALLFASTRPLPADELGRSVPAGIAVEQVEPGIVLAPLPGVRCRRGRITDGFGLTEIIRKQRQGGQVVLIFPFGERTHGNTGGVRISGP